MIYPDVELADIAPENQSADEFKQMVTVRELYIYQQLFWLAMSQRVNETNPEDWTVKVSGIGVDLESKSGSAVWMGHWSSTQTILHGMTIFLDDIFKMLGGTGIPRDLDENGDALPLDVEKVKAEIKRLVECK